MAEAIISQWAGKTKTTFAWGIWNMLYLRFVIQACFHRDGEIISSCRHELLHICCFSLWFSVTEWLLEQRWSYFLDYLFEPKVGINKSRLAVHLIKSFVILTGCPRNYTISANWGIAWGLLLLSEALFIHWFIWISFLLLLMLHKLLREGDIREAHKHVYLGIISGTWILDTVVSLWLSSVVLWFSAVRPLNLDQQGPGESTFLQLVESH